MTAAIERAARRRTRLHADRDHCRAGADGAGAVGARQHHRAMAAELESRRRPHPAQRGDRHRAAADRRRSRRGRICPGQSRFAPSAVRRIGAVRHVRAHGAGTERRSGARCGAGRRDDRAPRIRHGSFAGAVRAAAAQARRCRNKFTSATRWCCCVRRSGCPSPMPVRTGSGKARGRRPTSCRP